MFSDVEADIYVMADGDETYDAAIAPELIRKLIDENLDMVVGTRVAANDKSFRAGHKFGNHMLTGLVKYLFGYGFEDTPIGQVPTGNRRGGFIVHTWDAGSGKELQKMEGHTDIVSSAFSLDGTKIVAANRDGTAHIWDVESGEELQILKGHTRTLTSIAFSPEGTKIVTGSFDGTARIWSLD